MKNALPMEEEEHVECCVVRVMALWVKNKKKKRQSILKERGSVKRNRSAKFFFGILSGNKKWVLCFLREKKTR